MDYEFQEDRGRISEWNEGHFKSSRLNEIQDRINFWKLDLTARTRGKFNYLWLIRDINNLLEEGWSKYSEKERAEVDSTREMIEKALKNFPPTKMIINEQIGGTETEVITDEENLFHLKELMLIFEREVKDLNDKHGLTTMNRDDDFNDPYN